jgi:extracellular elastinolytic metalloproteinase
VKPRVARRTSALGAVVVTTLAVGLGQSAVPAANAAPQSDKTSQSGLTAAKTPAASAPEKGFYDARAGGGATAKNRLFTKAGLASSRPATDKLRSSLGKQAVVDMDGLTGTVRQVAKLNGFLTAKSSASATKVAMGYVRSHAAALGLTSADLKTFRLSDSWTDVAGIRHVSWTQSVHGVHVFGNGLKASVTRDGRLLTIGGSPVARLNVQAGGAAKMGPSVHSRGAAIAAPPPQGGAATLNPPPPA